MKTAAVLSRSVLRFAVQTDFVELGHRAECGSRSFAVAGPSCWKESPAELRKLSTELRKLSGFQETSAGHLKTPYLFRVFLNICINCIYNLKGVLLSARINILMTWRGFWQKKTWYRLKINEAFLICFNYDDKCLSWILLSVARSMVVYPGANVRP